MKSFVVFFGLVVFCFFCGISLAEDNCECSRQLAKEWFTPVGRTTKISLGSFELVVDNTAGPWIISGRGVLRCPIPGSDKEQFIEIPAGDANASRRSPIWLIERSQGFKIDFYSSSKGGGVVLRATRFER